MEILDEVDALRAIKPNVPQLTLFGDDNWEAIEAQVAALIGSWSEDAVYDYYDDGELNDNERDAALDVIAWREGDYEDWEAEDGTVVDSPSLDWAQLAK
jgi:hypothetical protein